jgi:hypothetical protein
VIVFGPAMLMTTASPLAGALLQLLPTSQSPLPAKVQVSVAAQLGASAAIAAAAMAVLTRAGVRRVIWNSSRH